MLVCTRHIFKKYDATKFVAPLKPLRPKGDVWDTLLYPRGYCTFSLKNTHFDFLCPLFPDLGPLARGSLKNNSLLLKVPSPHRKSVYESSRCHASRLPRMFKAAHPQLPGAWRVRGVSEHRTSGGGGLGKGATRARDFVIFVIHACVGL